LVDRWLITLIIELLISKALMNIDLPRGGLSVGGLHVDEALKVVEEDRNLDLFFLFRIFLLDLYLRALCRIFCLSGSFLVGIKLLIIIKRDLFFLFRLILLIMRGSIRLVNCFVFFIL